MNLPVVSKAEISTGRVPGEMDVFIDLIARINPTVVVEFGVNEGIIANELLLRFVDIERYVGIDNIHNPECLAACDPRFELIVRRHGSLDLTAADLPMCDVAYIDGDHSYKVVKHDSELAQRIVRQGGIIIWHDVENRQTPDVKRALEEFRERGWPIKQVDQTWLAFMEV